MVNVQTSNCPRVRAPRHSREAHGVITRRPRYQIGAHALQSKNMMHVKAFDDRDERKLGAVVRKHTQNLTVPAGCDVSCSRELKLKARAVLSREAVTITSSSQAISVISFEWACSLRATSTSWRPPVCWRRGRRNKSPATRVSGLAAAVKDTPVPR